jgi:hypothetical protein
VVNHAILLGEQGKVATGDVQNDVNRGRVRVRPNAPTAHREDPRSSVAPLLLAGVESMNVLSMSLGTPKDDYPLPVLQ